MELFSFLVEVDFSQITTESLKELLKIDPEELHACIMSEVQRREVLAAEISTITPARASGCCCKSFCFGYCYNKTCEEFYMERKSENHYVLQVPKILHATN